MPFFACPEPDTPLRLQKPTKYIGKTKEISIKNKSIIQQSTHIHCNIRSNLRLLDSGFSLNTKKSVRFEFGLQSFQVSESESEWRVAKHYFFWSRSWDSASNYFLKSRRRGLSLTRISSLTLSNILILIIKRRSWAKKIPDNVICTTKYCNL